MLLPSAFSKENSAISLDEWVLVFKVFTTASRKLRVNEIRLVGLLVKRPLQERQTWFDPGFPSGDFSRSSHTSDLTTGPPVATLSGAWHFSVRAGTGWSGVSILS